MTELELEIAKKLKHEKIEKLEFTSEKVVIWIKRENGMLNEKLTKENYTFAFSEYLISQLG